MTILLHGFWGQPKDWNSVLHQLPLTAAVLTPDLYSAGELSPQHELKQWCENFWRWVDENHGREPVQLVGYSMGARLALSAAVHQPERVQRALFISGNPLLAATDFSQREQMENEWSNKFLTMGWDELAAAWDEQPVFNGTRALERRQSPELREMLGLSLRRWSPRLHAFREAELKSLPGRMEWAFGALDQKYLSLAKSLQELPVQGQITLVPGAGHRLIVDRADFVSAWIAGEK